MAPIKKMTRKEIGLQECPWINHDILVAMSERNKLHKSFLLEKNDILRQEMYVIYKAKRNLVNSKLRKAKKEYFNVFFKKIKTILRKHGKVSGT